MTPAARLICAACPALLWLVQLQAEAERAGDAAQHGGDLTVRWARRNGKAGRVQ